MAKFITKLKALRNAWPGKLIEILIYALMLALILIFFSGNGTFIYEGI